RAVTNPDCRHGGHAEPVPARRRPPEGTGGHSRGRPYRSMGAADTSRPTTVHRWFTRIPGTRHPAAVACRTDGAAPGSRTGRRVVPRRPQDEGIPGHVDHATGGQPAVPYRHGHAPPAGGRRGGATSGVHAAAERVPAAG